MLEINKIIEKLKRIYKAQSKKKLIENAVILAIIGIIIIVAGSTFFGKSNIKVEAPVATNTSSIEASSKSAETNTNSNLENDIEKILSQISGVGKVNVMITYSTGKEIVPATDTKTTENNTQEKDNGGGTRNINQSNNESSVVYEENQSGSKTPIIIKELLPQVKGVVVVAEGAGDITIKENLTRAVQVLMDVPMYKIQVFTSGK